MNFTRKVRVLVAGVIIISTTTALAACQVESPTDELKKTGKTSQQVDGETTWGNGEGPAYTPTPELPSSFPVSEVPLADGAIVDAGERSPGVWFVNIQAQSDAALSDAIAKLTTVGFSTVSDEKTGADRALVLENDRYSVNLLSIHGADQIVLSYDISSKTS